MPEQEKKESPSTGELGEPDRWTFVKVRFLQIGEVAHLKKPPFLTELQTH